MGEGNERGDVGVCVGCGRLWVVVQEVEADSLKSLAKLAKNAISCTAG